MHSQSPWASNLFLQSRKQGRQKLEHHSQRQTPNTSLKPIPLAYQHQSSLYIVLKISPNLISTPIIPLYYSFENISQFNFSSRFSCLVISHDIHYELPIFYIMKRWFWLVTLWHTRVLKVQEFSGHTLASGTVSYRNDSITKVECHMPHNQESTLMEHVATALYSISHSSQTTCWTYFKRNLIDCYQETWGYAPKIYMYKSLSKWQKELNISMWYTAKQRVQNNTFG